jgi:RNA polymerase sigma-70 factor (ECF subfamily)
MEAYQAGDVSAANELVETLSPFLLRFVRRTGGRQTEPVDLLQDCWLAVHKARHTFRPESPVIPWIVAIARHVRADAIRRQVRSRNREIDLTSAAHMPAASACSYDEIVRMVNELPANQSRAFVLTKLEGFSLQEVARLTKTSVAAVKQRLSRAYSNLRRIAGERGSRP